MGRNGRDIRPELVVNDWSIGLEVPYNEIKQSTNTRKRGKIRDPQYATRTQFLLKRGQIPLAGR